MNDFCKYCIHFEKSYCSIKKKFVKDRELCLLFSMKHDADINIIKDFLGIK
jgi:hypothetical protein